MRPCSCCWLRAADDRSAFCKRCLWGAELAVLQGRVAPPQRPKYEAIRIMLPGGVPEGAVIAGRPFQETGLKVRQ